MKNSSFSMKNHIKDKPLTTTLKNEKKNNHRKDKSTHHKGEDERLQHEQRKIFLSSQRWVDLKGMCVFFLAI